MGESDRDILRRAPMLAALDDAAWDDLLSRGGLETARAGTVLFLAGAPAEALYVVLAGRVKVYHLSPRGDEQVLHFCEPGDAFAEAAALSGGAYPASASATEDARLLRLSRTALREAIRRRPELAMGMLAGMSAKLRQFARLIEDLSLKEVPQRLAGVLLDEAGDRGGRVFRLRQSKRELASRIGTVAATLSRALRGLQEQGLIDVRGAEVRLLDAEGLRRLAGRD